MSLADALGADAPHDPRQGLEDLGRQVSSDDVQQSHPVDPGRLSDALAGRMDRKTRHIDENPAEVQLPSSYGESVISGSKPSSFGEVVKPRGLAIIDLFWNVATSSTVVCFDAVVLLAALAVGDFPLVKYLLPVVGPYVPVASPIAILAFGLVAVLIGFRIFCERKALKNQKSQIEGQTEAVANCGAPSVLKAHGEQASENPPHMLACWAFCETKEEFP